MKSYNFNFTNYLEEQELKEINLLSETFDTKYNIDKVVKTGDVTEYYLTISDFEYRVLIERNKDAVRVMFEVFRNREWRTTGITNNLSTKETLTLFGTILDILKKIKFNHVFIDTREPRKLRLYKKLASKLLTVFEKGEMYVENSTIIVYDVDTNQNLTCSEERENENK